MRRWTVVTVTGSSLELEESLNQLDSNGCVIFAVLGPHSFREAVGGRFHEKIMWQIIADRK